MDGQQHQADNIEHPESTLTCVSGYWQVKNKHNHDDFDKWFPNTLSINCPYVFFTDKQTKPIIQKYRANLPTYYIECSIDEFKTQKYKSRMLIHPVHCPSVDLNLIWNEKIYLIAKASDINPFKSDYFMWVDAGICSLRNQPPPLTPFPNMDKLKDLPIDKFIYSVSQPYNRKLITNNRYYHHISGGVYILHITLIPKFVKIYTRYLDVKVSKNNIWTDQVILTHIFKDMPGLFYKFGNTYGDIITNLFTMNS